MRRSSAFHVLVFLMLVMILGTPFIGISQQDPVQAEATAAAEQDAEARVNRTVWRILGCTLNAVGIAGGYIYEPPLPAQALLGKSPEYVAFYTDAYIETAKNLQTLGAVEGCIFSTCAVSAYIGIFSFFAHN